MFRTGLVLMLSAGVASIAPAFAQSEAPLGHQVTVQALGTFTNSTTQNGVENAPTNSGGVLGSYRYFFSKHFGVDGSYAYSRNSQNYRSATDAIGVKTDTHEITGAFVFRLPMHKITPFALAGAGAIVFDPKDFAGASHQTRAAFVYGAGADFQLTSHLFARAQYRGLVYNSPTYDINALQNLDRISHRAEPSIGFGYHF